MSDILNITKETFNTIQVPQSLKVGQPIGFGKCKAVKLKLNAFVRNVTTNTFLVESYIYIGDAKAQEYELPRSIDSILIITDRLEKIYVRNPFVTAVSIQVRIFQ